MNYLTFLYDSLFFTKLMHMRKLLLIATLILCTVLGFAQSRLITGKVTDEGGAGVSGASVNVKGSTYGVSADATGVFKINAKAGDVLVVSATNYTTKKYVLPNWVFTM